MDGKCKDNKESFMRINTLYDMKITKILLKFGIRANCSGYKYLRCAIMYACLTPGVTKYITKTVYPFVARAYGITPSVVGRTCRRAIDAAYNGKNNSAITEYFKSCDIMCKPTCSEFIILTSNLLKNEVESSFCKPNNIP